MSKDSPAKYYQNNKKKNNNNMVVNNTKIYQKMKNKKQVQDRKQYYKVTKNPDHNYNKLLF